MARLVPVFTDNAGNPHTSAQEATVSDLASLLGNYALAVAVLDRRLEIERLFAEHDVMLCESIDNLIPAEDLT